MAEMLDGRVKTLHPRIHGASWPTGPPGHRADMEAHGIAGIDLVS